MQTGCGIFHSQWQHFYKGRDGWVQPVEFYFMLVVLTQYSNTKLHEPCKINNMPYAKEKNNTSTTLNPPFAEYKIT